MIFLVETSRSFKILLVASEIIIPIIIVVGAYFIFKPMIKKNKELQEQQKKDAMDNELD